MSTQSSGDQRAILDAPTLNGGAVELREDVPLKRSGRSSRGVGGAWGAGGAWGSGGSLWCMGGPRVIPGAFGLLSACITVALVAQIYCGDYELVPHGGVSSGAAACSRAGTDALKAGGRAMDAAVAAALCLAALAPHRTSLDASGSLLYWEYRESRKQQPVLYEWGGIGNTGDTGERPPRLVAALAQLHSQLGALPWPRLLQPALHLASEGFNVSEGLAGAAARAGRGIVEVGSSLAEPQLANYLATLLANTSTELSLSWGGASLVHASSPAIVRAGDWRVVAGGEGAGAATRGLQVALDPPPASTSDAQERVVSALYREALAMAGADAAVPGGGTDVPGGVATGLAVVDRLDTYLALVTGLSVPFGSGPVSSAGWSRDEPPAPLDLAPAFIVDTHVCGSRYVLGAESWVALAQAGAALAISGSPSAVEAARLAWETGAGGGALAKEAAREAPSQLPPALPQLNASQPYAAVNVVAQRGDALSSHADSRGGGLASRF